VDEILQPVKAAASRLGISVWTLRKKAYRGEVASVKIGVKLLIPESEIERLICEGLRPRLLALQGSAITRVPIGDEGC
jgi:excisionase family DNA binding protein